MKTLIVYEKDTGNISFAQSLNGLGNVEYDSIIADIPEDRTVARVEDGEVVLEDTKEVKEVKERLKEIEAEEQEIKKKLLSLEMGLK